MNEYSYVRSIHTLLRKRAPHVYIWKINDNYAGGVADAYYSADRDMWIEYKYLKSLPKRPDTLIDFGLSELQKAWLEARHREGRTVAVIVGSDEGSILLSDRRWQYKISCADFKRSAVDKGQVIAYILGNIVNV